MFAATLLKTRFLPLVTVTGLTAIVLLGGGCPVAQQPTTPAEEQEQLEPPGRPEPDGDLDRPIPPPDVDGGDDQEDSGGGDIVGGGGGSGAGGDALLVTVNGPTEDLLVRLSTLVEVHFRIFDALGALTAVDLLLVRDADGDHQPDGSPVFEEALSFQAGSNSYSYNTTRAQHLLENGFARFLVGIRYQTVDGQAKSAYAPGSLTIDSQVPTAEWISPNQDLLLRRSAQVQVRLSTTDNRPLIVRVRLDPDQTPDNGNQWPFIGDTDLPAGTSELNTSVYLGGFPVGTYHYHVTVSDGVKPPVSFYAQTQGSTRVLMLTNRLVGDFDLNQLADSDNGAILQGFNFNDLAGSSMTSVPDVNGDGHAELVVVSRFGKPQIINHDGVGFGEAYLAYGSPQRLRGIVPLNSIGRDPDAPDNIPGLVFTGIRNPLDTGWTAGLSDVAVIPDMDGDEMPEIVFSFPRVESISLSDTDPTVQHPDLLPDLDGVGVLEYSAYYDSQWHPNEAQFTRGGIVIVSSHDQLLRDPMLLNRKSDRIIDLHEVGQLFTAYSLEPQRLVPYIRQALRRDELDPPRHGPFVVCADCDGEPPEGCDPENPDDPDACGDDACTLNDTTRTDGRETPIERWVVQWDVVFANEAPGGFFTEWTPIPAFPPLVNNVPFPFGPDVFPFEFYPNHWVASGDACADDVLCEVTNEWFDWSKEGVCGGVGWFTEGEPQQLVLPNCYPDNPCPIPGNPPPCGPDEPPCTEPPITVDVGTTSVWSGFYSEFYGPCVQAYVVTPNGVWFAAPIGARVLGQHVDDRFGTSVSADDTWLYISAPLRTPNAGPYVDDVPTLPDTREQAGTVYQLRTYAPGANGITRTQLWIEPQPSLRWWPPCCVPPFCILLTRPPWWPWVDTELAFRTDTTMPVPHQYIIEVIGSLRGVPDADEYDTAFGDPGDPEACPPPYDPGTDGYDMTVCDDYYYPAGTAGYYMDRTLQIVGPHPEARIEFVRSLGDVDGDGIRDFAVGSASVRQDVVAGSGPTVGAIFILYARPTGLEGDYLLEQLAFELNDPDRLNGVLVKGSSAGETLAHVFADAGDVNGDGYADVLIGNEGFEGGTGEAVLLLGSSTLVSPGGGWTPATIPEGRAVRFTGVEQSNYAGANVAGAGDVDGDGYADILIAAPGAEGARGVVYLVYGSRELPREVNLADVGTFTVPGVRFIGRRVGDVLGGGVKTVEGTDPNGGATTAFSRGVARLGDLDSDGRDDYAISAMLADLTNKTDAGEIYILYGVGD